MKIKHNKNLAMFTLSLIPKSMYNNIIENINIGVEFQNLIYKLSLVSSIKYAKKFFKKAKKLSYQQTGNNTEFIFENLSKEIFNKKNGKMESEIINV